MNQPYVPILFEEIGSIEDFQIWSKIRIYGILQSESRQFRSFDTIFLREDSEVSKNGKIWLDFDLVPHLRGKFSHGAKVQILGEFKPTSTK